MRKEYQYIRDVKIRKDKVHIVFSDRENLEISSVDFSTYEIKNIMRKIEEYEKRLEDVDEM